MVEDRVESMSETCQRKSKSVRPPTLSKTREVRRERLGPKTGNTAFVTFWNLRPIIIPLATGKVVGI